MFFKYIFRVYLKNDDETCELLVGCEHEDICIYIMMKGNESTKCLVWNGAVFARVGHEQSQAGHIDALAGIKLIIKALQWQRCLP